MYLCENAGIRKIQKHHAKKARPILDSRFPEPARKRFAATGAPNAR